MNEPEPFPIFVPQHYFDLLPRLILIKAQIEGERRAKLQAKAEDFARRYPLGMDAYGVKPPKQQPKKLFNFIPEHYERTLLVESIPGKAKARGYSDEEIAEISRLLEPPLEPVLISIEDEDQEK